MAMKVNELMVGDWVNMGNPVTDELVPTKIENIYGEEINCKTDHTSDDVPTIIYGEWLRYAQPIPLTEEILVKNGFGGERRSKYFHLYTLEFDTWDFEIYWGSVNGFSYENIKLSYVHELQHLLRLAGVQKDIEL